MDDDNNAQVATEENVPEGTAPPVEKEQQQEAPKRNPAWNNLLNKLPAEFHDMIDSDLREWDNNFSTKISEVQSQYEPYKEFVDNQVSPDDIKQALAIGAMIESDPGQFLDAMTQWAEQSGLRDQGQQEQENDDDSFSLDDFDDSEDDDDDISSHPKFQELEQQQRILAEFLAQQVQQEETAKAEAELDAEIKTLTEKYGEFDEELVLPYAMTKNVPLEDAVKFYSQRVESIKSAPRPGDYAPSVLNPSGTIPSSQPDPGKMSSRETKNLVKEMLAAAKAQG